MSAIVKGVWRDSIGTEDPDTRTGDLITLSLPETKIHRRIYLGARISSLLPNSYYVNLVAEIGMSSGAGTGERIRFGGRNFGSVPGNGPAEDLVVAPRCQNILSNLQGGNQAPGENEIVFRHIGSAFDPLANTFTTGWQWDMIMSPINLKLPARYLTVRAVNPNGIASSTTPGEVVIFAAVISE